MMDFSNPVWFSEKLVALSLLVQTAELFSIRHAFADKGVWQWRVLKKEFSIFPKAVQLLFAAVFPFRPFLLLLGLRLVAAIALLWTSNVLLVGYLLLSTILICLRWRGTFNGGSDYMSIVVLSALFVAELFSTSHGVVLGCLWYIALQSALSYFIAGVVKLRRVNWRNGRALAGFLNSPDVLLSSSMKKLFGQPVAALTCSWGIMAFECLFPVALLHSTLCLVFVGAAFVFHLVNAYVFGLNRFLLAWSATYPALYFCSSLSVLG